MGHAAPVMNIPHLQHTEFLAAQHVIQQPAFFSHRYSNSDDSAASLRRIVAPDSARLEHLAPREHVGA